MASLHRQTGTRTGYKLRWRDPAKRAQSLWLGDIAKRSADTYFRHVCELIDAQSAGRGPQPETESWLRSKDIDGRIRSKLVELGLAVAANPMLGTDAGRLLGPFCDAYIAGRSDCKPGTGTNFKQARRLLCELFGETKPLAAITPADADRFRRWLMARPMAESTVSKHIKRTKTMFASAVRDRLLNSSPFADQKAGCEAGETYFHVPEAMAVEILEACPDSDWRLIFGLARWAGLRCPSEVLTLKWSDILWDQNRMRIDSPKTGLRFCPLFGPLRRLLGEAHELAPEGSTFCVERYRYNRVTGVTFNPGTTMKKIIERAGHQPWPALFIALRKTCRNELELAGYRATAINAWIGHDRRTADKHYSRVTETDWDMANGGNAGGNTLANTEAHRSQGNAEKPVKPTGWASPGLPSLPKLTPTGLEPVLPP